MNNDLAHTIALRESGRAEEARQLLLELVQMQPDNAQIHYQTAWAHDVLGLEREAVPFYERALELGLDGEERAGAFLGLGSTYRTLGEYDKAIATLRKGIDAYPGFRALEVFLSMALYNKGEHQQAMELLLRIISETSSDESVGAYSRAIDFYADKLDQTW
jgi:tetratricopeptide (TPR) repeat protein